MSTKFLLAIVAVSTLMALAGVFAAWKYYNARRHIQGLDRRIERANQTTAAQMRALDRLCATRMVFLHHSVGRGILQAGGLQDSLLEMGVSVKGATYGDEIGQHTDIPDWPEKFRTRMDDILSFQGHPNRSYEGVLTNDIVMFKSCFPNSDIGDGGSGRTLSSFQAEFEKLTPSFAAQPGKLFIYLTAPPLHPGSTTPANAERAREFNNWVIGEFAAKYRKETGLNNLLAFDLFGVLADSANVLKAEYHRSGGGGDSHPNKTGSRAAAAKFMEFFREEMAKRSAPTD